MKPAPTPSSFPSLPKWEMTTTDGRAISARPSIDFSVAAVLDVFASDRVLLRMVFFSAAERLNPMDTQRRTKVLERGRIGDDSNQAGFPVPLGDKR